MVINKVVVLGFLDTRRVLNRSNYDKTKEEFLDKYLIELPRSEDLPVKLSDARVLLSPIKVKVYSDEGVHVYDFEKGFITDFASIPDMFRSLIDNDDEDIVLSALVHDANFRYHFMSFEKSNTLFRLMNRKAGLGFFKSWASYCAVSTSFGREAYTHKKPHKLEFCEYNWRDR